MQIQFDRVAHLDGFAMVLSSLCIVHCLFLPLLVTLLPVLAIGAEQEWIHQLLAIMAVPVSGLAFIKSKKNPFTPLIRLSLITGIAMLIVSAFWIEQETPETLITVTGALLLLLGHGLRWRFHRHKV